MRKIVFILMALIILVLFVAEYCNTAAFTQSDREFNTWIVLFVGIVVVIFVFCGFVIIYKWLWGAYDEIQ